MALGAFELGVRLLLTYGVLEPDPTLDRHVERQVSQLEEAEAVMWLVGNSTLAEGVDVQDFNHRTGAGGIRLVHGSATLRASAAMLEYYAGRLTRPPREVLVFLLKDDLNANGYGPVPPENSVRLGSLDLTSTILYRFRSRFKP